MGVRILDAGTQGAALYCPTTGWTVGPICKDREEAEGFLAFLAAVDASVIQLLLRREPVTGDGSDPRDWEASHLEEIWRLFQRVCARYLSTEAPPRPLLLDVSYDRPIR